ncbi:M14 family metallopeptidase [Flavobacterium sp. 3HN19-14]|uniref:M14 family metallopeptidase n=1 Tax=Flavobacterium sp. 3HN19-14 TaxID=3448133 RepID=UPI003EE14C11
MNFEQIYNQFKEEKISERYITLNHIEPILNRLSEKIKVAVIGKSVLERPIYSCQSGSGKIKILIWSQMHGNESTTTKALLDFFNLLESDAEIAKDLLNRFSFCIIPILNPDGAEAYTRVNANKIDLNRDAQDLSQPESIVLRRAYNDFEPDFCFNMHDQRTIFGVGDTNKPATVSFLAPSYDEERNINAVREKAVSVIVAMNNTLQQFIPGQVGRFDDGFNLNCVGDTFQHAGTPTILFEAGHFQGDYEREETRKFIFFALLSAFDSIYENVIVDNVFEDYVNIPQNNPRFFDFVYKNIKINYDSSDKFINFAAQFNEELIDNQIFFNAFVVKIGDLEENVGHTELDGNGQSFKNFTENSLQLNQKADFFIGESVQIRNGIVQS